MKNNKTLDDHRSQMRLISRICSDLRIESLKPQIAAFNEIVSEKNVINVAILGRFKSGKSSFLNSLIGKDIVPVGILPLTAIITRIRYGNKDKAEVISLDGKIKSINIADLPDYIAEERNPENIKNIDRVDITLSVLKDYKNIQFVDTPGMGSVHQHNTETSRSWMPRAGAAFLAISIDHPLSEDDIELLRELEKHTPEVHILLTKIDIVSSKEVEIVIRFMRAQIRQKLNKETHIFSFSNRPGYRTERSSVFKFIREAIGGRQVENLGEIIQHKFDVIAIECYKYIKLGLSAAKADQESNKYLIQQIRHERESLPAVQDEICVIIDELRQKMQTEAQDMFDKQRVHVLKILRERLKKDMRGWNGNIGKAVEDFQRWEEKNFIAALKPVSEECGLQLTDSYSSASLDSCLRIVRAFQGRLANEIERSLHIHFPAAKFEVKIKEPKIPDVFIGNNFTASWDIIWFLAPMRIFRPLVTRNFVSRLPWHMGVSLSRLASQWKEALSNSMDNVAQQAIDFINKEIDTVENLLISAPDRHHEIENAIMEMKSKGVLPDDK